MTASIAACLTILSYVATAVVSAAESMAYARNLSPVVDVFSWTLMLLLVISIINLMGINESAVVALGIFAVHIATLIFLILVGIVYAAQKPEVLTANWRSISHPPNPR
jgi:amino acid transporter